MPEFIENLLTGIRRWVNGKIADMDTAIDNKQDILTAGDNIEITSGGTINVTGITMPVASDFDIKDLADSDNLRSEWSAKQDALTAGDNIEITSGGTINVTGITGVIDAELEGLTLVISSNINELDGRLIDVENNKQDVISDLSTIRSGAALGATALQSVPSEYVTDTELASELANYATTSALTSGLATKQDTLTAGDNIEITSGGTINVTGITGVIESELEDLTLVISSNINELDERLVDVETNKQDALTPGDNIEITSGGTINVTGVVQSVKTINNQSIVGTGNITIEGTQGEPGVGLEYTWSGTELGVKREDESEYTYVNLQGEQGEPGTPGTDGNDGQDGQDGVGLEYTWNGTELGVKRENEADYSYTDLRGSDGSDGIIFYPLSWEEHNEWVTHYAEEHPELTWVTDVTSSSTIIYYMTNIYDWTMHSFRTCLVWDAYRPFTMREFSGVTYEDWEDMRDDYTNFFMRKHFGAAIPFLFPWGDVASINTSSGEFEWNMNIIGKAGGNTIDESNYYTVSEVNDLLDEKQDIIDSLEARIAALESMISGTTMENAYT